MAFAIFRGIFDLAIDEKNRLLIPADVRRAMNPEIDGESFIMKYGWNGRPWLYGKNYENARAAKAESDEAPADEAQDFDQYSYALSEEVVWDKQGRVVVPQDFITWAKLDKEVCLVAVKDHLELWNRPEWLKRKEELLAKAGEIAAKQRLAKQALGGGTAGGK